MLFFSYCLILSVAKVEEVGAFRRKDINNAYRQTRFNASENDRSDSFLGDVLSESVNRSDALVQGQIFKRQYRCTNLSAPHDISQDDKPSCASHGQNRGCGCFIYCTCNYYEKCYSDGWWVLSDDYSRKVGHCDWSPLTYGAVGAVLCVGFLYMLKLIWDYCTQVVSDDD
eukprot:TRINITY_DN39379_c0_g1_i1.p1 TRINITY_DN39379_c0_g1~~TRINITY_DN39379_c0_g1_i1.p1  ORF type:complete len:190 (-),score=15.67 TRINITY_DN39379_c0_g1_i1:85-594(-)